MKYNIKLENDKGMKESEVRSSIDRAAEMARQVSIRRGEGDAGHESFRRKMVEHAEMDKKKGKL